MINYFLKAKHWQLFLFAFVVPFFVQIVLTILIVVKFKDATYLEMEQNTSYFYIFPLLALLYLFGQMGWLYSLAVGLQKKIPQELRLKINRFKLLFFIPIVYILGFLSFFMIVVNNLTTSTTPQNFDTIFYFLPFLLLFHIASIACIFHTNYFVAKTFKTAELQREVLFKDFIGEFFMIWFFIIGIWFLQPKINKIADS